MGTKDILLVPEPTRSHLDPLTWPQRKKYTTLAILCLAAFAGTASSLVNQLAIEVQGKLYHRTPIQMSYAISAAMAGHAFGPLFFVPLTRIIGRCSTIWWSLVGAVACNIWSASMTHSNQYNPFVISRLFAGTLGSVPSILGASFVTDLFYLHERGKAFLIFSLSFLMGTVAGPTLGGFIVAHVDWPVDFWWTAGLQGLALVLVFLFLEETGFSRDEESAYPERPKPFVANRVATFFLGTKVVPAVNRSELLHSAIAPFAIGVSPVTILTGTFQLLSFGWFSMVVTLLTVYLQEREKRGGYGFTPQQNAEFTFSLWFGIILAQIYGHYLNDWLPLWLCARNGGTWKPEYRLHTLWLPSLILYPIGLGIFGVALQYHTHYMVLALAVFLITFSATLSVPVTVNYVIECFRQHALETSAIIGSYRLAFSLAVPFFIIPWEKMVGVGWVFGMTAFFCVGSFMLLVLLMWKGHEIRTLSLDSVASTEEGSKVTKDRATLVSDLGLAELE